jgi:pSer/pThr/pTyr-binding forkhead associated (FHA) protein
MPTPPRDNAVPHEGTRLETVEEIRDAIRSRRGVQPKGEEESRTVAFRPLLRPPLALLCIMDDGRDDGEWLRLRRERTVIGRTEGDVVIAHDTLLSSRHAEISRQADQGRYRWYLTDLQSTNGTFVRVSGALLRHGQEMLIGGRLYRFDAAPQGTALAEAVPDDAGPQKTRGWQSVSPNDLIPSLIELTPERTEAQRHYMPKADHWIGSDSAESSIVIANDPLINPRHVRIFRDGKGRWHVECGKSVNGTWLRVDRMALETSCQFQLGEQRFLFRPVS